MTTRRAELAREALDRTLELRQEVGLAFGVPLNVYDLCERLVPRVRIRFAEYSMEGCYHRSERPLIEVSALRPIGRRAFNAAHELGHHALGHSGMRLDEQIADGPSDPIAEPEEFAANAFAGFLLMPKIGVRRAFRSRGWQMASARPEQLFIIACHFGVGYATLVNHLAYGLQEISRARAAELSRVRLPAIRRALFGANAPNRIWVADRQYLQPTLDTEVGTTLVLPPNSQPEYTSILLPKGEIPSGQVFCAEQPGITRVEAQDWAVIVRVSRYQYSGWSTNRHLEPEDPDGDESFEDVQ